MKTKMIAKVISGISALAMASTYLVPCIHAMAAGTPVHSFDAFSLTFQRGANPVGIEDSMVWDDDTSSWVHDTVDNGYVWNAETSASGHAFIYNLNVVTSGEETIPVGDLEIRVPLHILRSSSGEYADTIELSIPSQEVYMANPDGTNIGNIYFYYTVDEDSGEVVIKNIKEIESGFVLDIPFQYTTNKNTWDYQDMGKSDACVAHGVIHSHDSLGEDAEALASSDSESVYIDTHVNIKSTTKKTTAKDIFYEWDTDAWGNNPDPDSDTEYVYFIWSINSIIGDDYAQQFNSSEITQKYDFSLNDVFNGLVSIDDVPYSGEVHGDIVAYKYQGDNWRTVTPDSDIEFPAVTGLTEKNGLSRTDYVIVRYPKTEISEVDVKYGISNSEVATVTPADGIDQQTSAESLDNIYLYTPPRYRDPISSADMKKYGIYTSSDLEVKNSGMVSSYALAEYKEGEDVPGFRYFVESDAFEYPYTFDRNKELSHSISDVDGYQIEDVTYTLMDDKLSLTDLKSLNSVALTDDDYYFTAIDYDIFIRPGIFDMNTQEYRIKNEFSDDDNVVVYYYVRGPGEVEYSTEPVASYDVVTGQYEVLNTSVVDSMDSRTIRFAQPVAGWKVESTNPYFRTLFRIKPTVTLLSTERVKSVIADNSDRVALDNTAEFKMINCEGNVIEDLSRTGRDYMAEVQRSSQITKKFVPTDENDIMNGQYKATWLIEVSETQQDDSGKYPVQQVGGTFYDVLPIVSTTKADLIEVYANDTNNQLVLGDEESGDYWVEFKSVTDNLGYDRVMLIVHVHDTVTADKYILKVRTIHTHEDILDYGRNIMNSVAYEKGNGDIADGYPDNGGTVSESYLLRNLDPDTDDKKFIYAQATHYIPALLFSSAGISKTVSSAITQPAQRVAVVTPDSDYVYTIRLKNSSSSSSKEIVVLDSIENFCNQNGVKLNGSDAFNLTKDWAGTPVSFGLNNLDYKNIDYKIYLSDEDNLDLTKYDSYSGDTFVNDVLADTSSWQLMDDFINAHGDISDAKAFMIDLSKKNDGSDFVLNAGESLSFTLKMHSPDSEPVTVDNVYPAETFNNIFSNQFSFTEITGETPDGKPIYDAAAGYNYKHQDYTSVNYHVVGDMKFKKIDSETLEPISGIQFNLSGTSVYGTDVNKNFVTGSTGIITYANLERGTYTLTEITDPCVDYLRGDARTVVVDGSGNVTITPDDRKATDASVTPVTYPLIKNDYRVHGDLHFTKIDADTLATLTGAEFTLTTQGNQKGNVTDYGNTYSASVTSTNSGVTFENIELGTYVLTETQYPEGYAPIKKHYTVVVSELGRKAVMDITSDDANDDSISKLHRTYQLKNEKFTELRIVKYDNVNKTEYLGGAEFKLYPTNETLQQLDTSQINTEIWKTNEFVQTRKTDINGIALFTEILSDGEYVLKETVAPDNHKLTDGKTEYTVKVVDGVITILGSDNKVVPSKVVDPTGLEFHLYNERTYDGEVLAIKKWVGDPLEYGSSFPELTFSTEEQKLVRKYATLDRTVFKSTVPNGATAFERLDLDDNYSDCKTIEEVVAKMQENGYSISLSDFQEAQVNRDGRSDKKDYIYYTNGVTGKTSYSMFGMTMTGQRDCSEETGKIYICKKNGTLFFWSDANVIYMPINCELLFDAYKGTGDLDVTNFYSDYTQVMAGAFFNCENITGITGLDKFNTSNVVIFGENRGMFQGCKKLEKLDLSGFDFGNAVNLKQMFNQCMVLNELKLPVTADATKVTSMQSMFSDCRKLSSIDLSGWTTSSALKSLNQTFRLVGNTSSDETHIYFGDGFVTSGVTDMVDTFRQMGKMKSLDISMFDFSSCTSMASTFYQCPALSSLTLPDTVDATKVTSMVDTFAECSSLSMIDLSGWKTSSALTNLRRTFYRYSGSNRTIKLGPDWDTSGVTRMDYMFDGSNNLKTIEGLYYLDTENVTNFEGMFYNARSLESIDLSSFVTKSGADVKNMFKSCVKLKTVYVNSDYWTNILQTSVDTFADNYRIVGENGTVYNSSNTNSAYARVDGAEGQPGYFTDYKTSSTYATDCPDGYSYWNTPGGTNGTNSTNRLSFKPFNNNILAGAGTSDVQNGQSEQDNEQEDSEDESVSVVYKTSKTPLGSLITDDTGSYYEVTENITLSNGETRVERARWYKNSDSEWVCYVKAYDPKGTYYVSEGEISGYESNAYLSSSNTTGLRMDAGSITIKNKKKNAEETKTGALQIQKVLVDGDKLHIEKADNDLFEFTVTLYKPDETGSTVFNGNTYTQLSGTIHYGGYEFIEGATTITLAGDESIIITDIPENYVYTIEETGVTGYVQSDIVVNPTNLVDETGGIVYTTAEQFNAVGQTIIADETSTVIWNNQIEKTELSISKTFVHMVDGVQQTLTQSEQDKQFNFTVVLGGLVSNEHYEYTGGSFDTVGTDEVTLDNIKLKSGDTITFRDLPVNATFEVVEEQVENIVTTVDGNPGNSLTGKLTIDGKSIQFVNTITTEQSVEVNVIKNWVGDTEADRPDSISVYLYRGVEGSLSDSQFVDDATLDAEHEWKTQFSGLPAKNSLGQYYSYTIVEGSVEGYIGAVENVVDANHNVVSTITNTKDVTPQYEFTLRKHVTGNLGSKSKQFLFTVTLLDADDKPLSGFKTVENNGNQVLTLFDIHGRTTISLSDGDISKILNIAEGTKVYVEEADYSSDGYSKSAVYTVGENTGSYTDGDIIVMTSDAEVDYTNHSEGAIPTGVDTKIRYIIPVMMLLLGGLLLTRASGTKKKALIKKQ